MREEFLEDLVFLDLKKKTFLAMDIAHSLVSRRSPAPVFDRLQYAKTDPEGLVNLTT